MGGHRIKQAKQSGTMPLILLITFFLGALDIILPLASDCVHQWLAQEA